MILCAGDMPSIIILLRTMETFSCTCGLKANKAKSEMYLSNVDNETQQQAPLVSGFKEGKMPFRYVGVPLNSKRLTVANCDGLVEKILKRLHGWSSKSLSYTAPATLINSVLINLHTYWAFVFVLPKSVIRKLEGICRNFLWEGKATHSKPPATSWDLVCKPKWVGGLGMRNGIAWNKCTIGKLVWDIANKADIL